MTLSESEAEAVSASASASVSESKSDSVTATVTVTMRDAQKSTGFNALDKATMAAGIAISLVMRVPAPLKSLADQVIRAITWRLLHPKP